jgi:hypothetical protein
MKLDRTFFYVDSFKEGKVMCWRFTDVLSTHKIKRLHRLFQTGSGAHAVSYRMGTGGSFPKIRRPEREADHTFPSSTDVKNGGVIPPLLHAFSWNNAQLMKYRDNFRSRDSSVGIATTYGLDDRGVGRVKSFLFTPSSRPALGSTQPLIQWVSGALRRG